MASDDCLTEPSFHDSVFKYSDLEFLFNPNLTPEFEKSSNKPVEFSRDQTRDRLYLRLSCLRVPNPHYFESVFNSFSIMTISLWNNCKIGSKSFVVVCRLYLRPIIRRGWSCCCSPVPFPSHNPASFIQSIGTRLCLSARITDLLVLLV